MARPREFNFDEALQNATTVFWKNGYVATSIDDLMKATGLSKQSVYNAFGDKQNFFLKVLQVYCDSNIQSVRDHIANSQSPRKAIEELLMIIVLKSEKTNCPDGCLLLTAITERTSLPPEAIEQIERMNSQLIKILTTTIAEAQKIGEISNAKSARDLAYYLFNALNGFRVLSKTGLSKKKIVEIVETTMGLI